MNSTRICACANDACLSFREGFLFVDTSGGVDIRVIKLGFVIRLSLMTKLCHLFVTFLDGSQNQLVFPGL